MNKWNLTIIYPSIEKWEDDLTVIKAEIEQYAQFKGQLTNLTRILEFLEFEETVGKRISKLYTYASMNYDQNQKNQKNLGYYGVVYNTYSNLVAASSYSSSELLAVGQAQFDKWMIESKKLREYRYMLDKLFHNQKHIFDDKLELIMANFNPVSGSLNKLYDQLAVADNNSTEVLLSTGETITVSESNFRGFLETLENQKDRQKVFEAVFKFYDQHKNTFAAIYSGVIQSNIADVKNRNYANVLDSYLYTNNIPSAVYESLVKTAKGHADGLKRYMQIRKEFFKLEELHTYDRFLTFAKTDEKYSYEECKDMFFESCRLIDEDFLAHAQAVLEDGRVDVMSTDGKRTGAYSTGVYDVGPFIMLNHNDNLNDAFTVVHEAGHSMHTMYASENQPYSTSDYVIFVAEIASTFNEQLLLDHLMVKCKDKNTKIALLQSAIDGLIGTFYRQTLFADYELQANKLAENGETITADVLSNIMKELYLAYYNIDLNTEPYKEYVWAYIPHFFHSPLYVYQYATSFAASLQIYDDVKNKKPEALDKYLGLLKSGGSDFPINLVKKAGVDLTSEKPFLAVVKRLDYLVDELEKLLK